MTDGFLSSKKSAVLCHNTIIKSLIKSQLSEQNDRNFQYVTSKCIVVIFRPAHAAHLMKNSCNLCVAIWRHQMDAFSALLVLCARNSPVTGEFPAQRPVTRSFDVFFDLPLSQKLSKQSRHWWFETPSRSLWRHCNDWVYCGMIPISLSIWYPYPSRLIRLDNISITKQNTAIPCASFMKCTVTLVIATFCTCVGWVAIHSFESNCPILYWTFER